MTNYRLTPPQVPVLPVGRIYDVTWNPIAGSGMTMSAKVTGKPLSTVCIWQLAIHRTYSDGGKIAGTAARGLLQIVLNGDGLKWSARVSELANGGSDRPLDLTGEGTLIDGANTVAARLVEYVTGLRPRQLSGKWAVPSAMGAPSGGVIVALTPTLPTWCK